MKTIMIEKICNELPVMYMPMAFIGSCLAGPIASSHAFLTFNVSVSSVVGAFVTDEEGFAFEERDLVVIVAVKPGGSATVPALGRLGFGGLVRRSTHSGGDDEDGAMGVWSFERLMDDERVGLLWVLQSWMVIESTDILAVLPRMALLHHIHLETSPHLPTIAR